MIPHVEDRNDKPEDSDLQLPKEIEKPIKWYHYVLLNRTLKISISFVLIAVLAPLLIYQFLYYAGVDLATSDGFSLGSCLVPRDSRLPCGLGSVSPDECHSQCCYDFSNNMCFHRYPSRFSFIMDRHWAENVTLKPRVATVPYKFQNSVTSLRLSIDEVSSTHMTITYYDSTVTELEGNRLDETEYSYDVDSPELNVIVTSKNRTIFDTLRGPTIASKDIWEIAFRLTEESMYGFGEIPIKGDTVKVIYNHRGGSSSIPLVFAKVNDTYHGLLIDNAEPTEVTFRNDNGILIRSITNNGLKFHIFVGPKPADIMRDVMKHVGFENNLEYWMLGLHVCSDNLNTTLINSFIQQTNQLSMPYESHCVSPVVLNNACDSEHAQIVDEGARLFRNSGKRFLPHVSPYIIYEEPKEVTESSNESDTVEEAECFIDFQNFTDHLLTDPDLNALYKGLVGNNDVIYPDYSNVSQEFMEKLWIYNMEYDGIVFENNWPLDESEKFPDEVRLWLPYYSESFADASISTIPWNTRNNNGTKQMYTHNEYGNHFAKAVNEIKPVPTWSSSQYMNKKTHVNRQNIITSWSNLHKELIEAALGGISGHWLWSSPICGDTENFHPDNHSDLCSKWYMASTYLPMIKVDSKTTERDPLSFSVAHRNRMISAIRTRLTLAPYFWTTLQKGPLLRPMFYQFPKIEQLKDTTSQFSVGDDLIIVPNLQPSQSVVHFWMPPGVWYELWSGLKMEASELKAITLTTTESDFLVVVRGGSIIIMQKDVKLTAERTRSESSLSLTIALDCRINNTWKIEQNATECSAAGTLYMEKDKAVNFEANENTLRITTEEYTEFCSDTAVWFKRILEINIYGLQDEFNNFDHHRTVPAFIDLCDLKTEGEILFEIT